MIQILILCPKYGLPELVHRSKSNSLCYSCQACGDTGIIPDKHKIINVVQKLLKVKTHKSITSDVGLDHPDTNNTEPVQWTLDVSKEAQKQSARQMLGCDYSVF